MGAVVSVPSKKAKSTKQIRLKSGKIVCDCNTPDLEIISNVEDTELKGCTINIDNSSGLNEFFNVQLVGGGAGGSSQLGGSAGETKVVRYPALNGEYVVILGYGGYKDKNELYVGRNGTPTALYKVKNDGKLELMEFALGGVGFSEIPDAGEVFSGDEKKGKIPSIEQTGETICGAGGDAGAKGNIGGAIISW